MSDSIIRISLFHGLQTNIYKFYIIIKFYNINLIFYQYDRYLLDSALVTKGVSTYIRSSLHLAEYGLMTYDVVEAENSRALIHFNNTYVN